MLPYLDWIWPALIYLKKCILTLVCDVLFKNWYPYRRKIPSYLLLYRYFQGKCSEVLTFWLYLAFWPRQTTYITMNDPRSLHISLIRRRFCLEIFFPRTTSLLNRIRVWSWHFRGKCYLSNITWWFARLSFSFAHIPQHTQTNYLELFLGLGG